MKLSDIRIYPVKSVAGEQQTSAIVDRMGLKGDRRLMLINKESQFVTQRRFPQMALIQAKLINNQLLINAPNQPELTVSLPNEESNQTQLNKSESDFEQISSSVIVWQDNCAGFIAKSPINQWFSDFIGTEVRLVSYDQNNPRPSDPTYSHQDDIVSYADGFPLLVISQASLDDLNSRLDTPVPMVSFRPNIVVSGCQPYAEDRWKMLKVGEVEFEAVKTCSRCVLTTVDPNTGIKRDDGQPLKQLSQYRRAPGGVMFGMNLIPRSSGKIKIGDQVEILK